jgi:hypothetical protein
MVVRRLIAFALLLLYPAAAAVTAFAQQNTAPLQLYPGAAPPPPAIEPEPLPPPPDVAPVETETEPQSAAAPAAAAAAATPAMSPPAERVFCAQQVSVQLADPADAPERYRHFIGVFSDAAWTPQLCAALIVESVTADGIARIVYAFGPMGASDPVPGGVLHGTGIVKDGELRFQNSDGSQFAFRPVYGDLDGRLTTPQGQTYEAMFKKTP